MSMNNAEGWLVKEKSLINHLFFFLETYRDVPKKT